MATVAIKVKFFAVRLSFPPESFEGSPQTRRSPPQSGRELAGVDQDEITLPVLPRAPLCPFPPTHHTHHHLWRRHRGSVLKSSRWVCFGKEADANTTAVVKELQKRYPALSDDWLATIVLSVPAAPRTRRHRPAAVPSVVIWRRGAGTHRAVNEEYVEPGTEVALNDRDEVRPRPRPGPSSPPQRDSPPLIQRFCLCTLPCIADRCCSRWH